MTTSEQRLAIGKFILDCEARRDSNNRLAVYPLPEGDRGGTYEVAGINDGYHPQKAAELKALIQAEKFDAAEAEASEYIASYTDAVGKWTEVAAIEAFLRDTAFNRGPGGAGRIVQAALGLVADGQVGPITISALEKATTANTVDVLQKLRAGRETYERTAMHRDESSPFWEGLTNRWNKALAFAKTLL